MTNEKITRITTMATSSLKDIVRLAYDNHADTILMRAMAELETRMYEPELVAFCDTLDPPTR